jgi:hypothetical protein
MFYVSLENLRRLKPFSNGFEYSIIDLSPGFPADLV